MLNKIGKHPSITRASDFIEICKPLTHLNINYFAHVKIDNEGRFSAVSNNPGFTEHYLKKEYYNNDIHLAKADLLKDYVIWDHIERDGKTAEMGKEALAFGIDHSFTIIEKGEAEQHFYHFGSMAGSIINQVYLSNLDLLKLFILNFREKISKDKMLTKAYDIRFSMHDQAGYSIAKASEIPGTMRNEFLENMQKVEKIVLSNKQILTSREIEVLIWMHQGKNARDIAQILNVADVTINKHILHIKEKLNCYSYFQLGEFFSKVMINTEEFIRYFSA